MEEILIGVMSLQEAKNHQIKLRERGVEIEFRSNPQTCTTGSCRVTVEVWAKSKDQELLKNYFQSDFLKHVQGHGPDFEHLSEVFDPKATEVICQACGAKFSPTSNECPDCGLVY